jgi:arylsulfatase A-like enzyme
MPFARPSRRWLTAGFALFLAGGIAPCPTAHPAPAQPRHRVIVFVWDGLRPDSINDDDTPHLAALARRGTFFADHHAVYPTFTMMNAAALASGAYSDKSGFFGNVIYRPGAAARDGNGEPVDLTKPFFLEDYGILRQLDANEDGHLLLVPTLFQIAQKAGLRTAVVGKSGPAFLQDYKVGGVVLDEKTALPLDFARELVAAHVALPSTASLAYRSGELHLAEDNGNPTARGAVPRLADSTTVDPEDRHGSPNAAANRYLMSVFLDYILPKRQPDLAVVWLRDPDSTEHEVGVGAPDYHAALRAQDELLGELEGRLTKLGLDAITDLLVVSDHGHSNVSGPLDLFPLRRVEDGKPGAIDLVRGYSVSGAIRLADALSRAGLRAYDGGDCGYTPVLSGILADGRPLHPAQAASANACGNHLPLYTTPAYGLLHPFLPQESLVVASNGGSDYLYQPDRDPQRIRMAVRFLQSHEEYGAIFVDDRYGSIPGTLPLSAVRLHNAEGRNPDIVVGYSFDEHAKIQGMPGIEFAGNAGFIGRGMHGSFSPIDVHNTLIAAGPDFARNYRDTLPSANIDVAPTIAAILALPMNDSDGRPLREALTGRAHWATERYRVSTRSVHPAQPATDLSIVSPIGSTTEKSRYDIELQVTELSDGTRRFSYFDWARAIRD